MRVPADESKVPECVAHTTRLLKVFTQEELEAMGVSELARHLVDAQTELGHYWRRCKELQARGTELIEELRAARPRERAAVGATNVASVDVNDEVRAEDRT